MSTVGQALPERTFGPLTRTDIVRYAGASGDLNPIHIDEPFAQKAGFPTVFAMGMLPAGLLATYATEAFGADRIRRYSVQFREQVWPDDVLTCSAVVTAVEEGEDGPTIEVALRCVRQTGGTAITGTATFVGGAA